MAIQQVIPGQAVKATQINELVNFCNDVELEIDEALDEKIKEVTTEEVTREAIKEGFDLTPILNRLAKVESDVNNLPGAMIAEASRILSTFKLTVRIQP